jgi:hypothetical protein
MLRRSLALFALLTLPAFAQEDPVDDSLPPDSGRRTRYSEVTHIDFGKLDVVATLEGPAVKLLGEPRREGFNPLIRLRGNFDEMMEQSVDEVR